MLDEIKFSDLIKLSMPQSLKLKVIINLRYYKIKNLISVNNHQEFVKKKEKHRKKQT